MFRYRTLFSRILGACVGLLLAAAVLINALCASGLRKQALTETVLQLSEGCDRIRSAFDDYYETGTTDETLFAYLNQMAETRQGSLHVADAYGNIVIELNYDTDYAAYEAYAKQNREVLKGKVQPGELCYAVYDGGRNYYSPTVTAAVAIVRGQSIVGTVYMDARIQGVEGVVRAIRQTSLGVVGILLLAAAILSLELSRRISKPLYQMNQAANELAKGNFDQRIEVSDRGEIGQLTQTFNAMAEALKKYEDTRSSFVGNVSHELKSPLTAIQGFIQGMLDGTIAPEEQKTYLEIVLGETRRMNALIIDLLDLVRIESDQFPMEMTEWDINELIRRCIIGAIGKLEEKRIEPAVEIPEERTLVRADQDRMTQVITNLLDNAIKFCEEGGSLKIWTYLSEGKVHVSISNSGQTIPPEDIDYIFDRFFKVDKSHNRKVPGTGIGLSIVKEIINRHDEKIWVSSKAGMGTVFTFTLTPVSEKPESKKKA